MELWLAQSPWIGIILWIILYISDYYLTIYSARGFRQIGHFKFEGGPELTPQYEKDIEALKPISRLINPAYSLQPDNFRDMVGVRLLSRPALGILNVSGNVHSAGGCSTPSSSAKYFFDP